jgi:hypothetical protein
VLAAGAIVVRQNHYIGTAQIFRMLWGPFPGALRITRCPDIPFCQGIGFLLAFYDKNRIAQRNRFDQLGRTVGNYFCSLESFAFACGGQVFPALRVKAIPVLAGRFAHVLAGTDAPDPSLVIVRIGLALLESFLGLAGAEFKLAVFEEADAANLQHKAAVNV